MSEFLGLPIIASAHGGNVDYLINLMHWFMFLLFIGWGAFYIYLLIRFRQSQQPKADYHGVKSHFSSYLEGGVVIFEAVLLVALAIPGWATWISDLPDEKDAVVVRVIGEQFAWNFHYPGEDGIFGKTAAEFVDVETNPVGIDPDDDNGKDDFSTINQLHVPVGKAVLLKITSKDVIHSFALNEMRVKQDAIPGTQVNISFTPTMTTSQYRQIMKNDNRDFQVGCAQLCGLGHYRMTGILTVHDTDSYDEWLDERYQEVEDAANTDDFWG